MTIAFRVDASTWMGSGHFMRCLILADELVSRRMRTIFISRRLPGNLIEIARGRGHTVFELNEPGVDYMSLLGDSNLKMWFGVTEEDDAIETLAVIKKYGAAPDLLVVDHYAASSCWDDLVHASIPRIFVIDDFSHAKRHCDYLLNQNYQPGIEKKYAALLEGNPYLLLGPRYALIHPEYNKANYSFAVRNGIIRKVLLFYGSADPTQETEKAIDAVLDVFGTAITLEVVIGSANRMKDRISKRLENCAQATLHIQLPHLAALFPNVDLFVGSGGATLWECLFLGIPALVTMTADNQVGVKNLSNERYGIKFLGRYDEVSSDVLRNALREAKERPEDLARLGKRGAELVDGLGRIRVADVIIANSPKIK